MAKQSEKIEIWRLNPKSIRLESAEKTLHETANKDGVKWCLPYSSANSLGYWIFSPIDFDVIWKGGKNFECKLLEPWDDYEHKLTKSLLNDDDINKFCPETTGRTKFTFGGIEENIIQLWTGVIFKTPPDWCLHIRSPINFSTQDFKVMEGILETDWMQYDIWINLIIENKNKLISFRKDSNIPMAQIIPIKRIEKLGLEDNLINNKNEIFDYWVSYNKKKFCCGGNNYLSETENKDSTTFYKERAKYVKDFKP